MATVKVKFRASTVEGKEGTLYYHLIHQRNLRWIALHMNIPIATISEGMGHNSFKTTQIYLQSLDMATINEANERIIKKIRLRECNEN